MPNYSFHPVLLLRSPVYSYSYYSEKNLSEVLKQPFFQKAIYLASEVFYNELKKADFELSKLEKKAVDTLKKYFNRMCFRPIPFGLCSAFGAAKWGDNATTIRSTNTGLQPHIQFSYAKGIVYTNTLLDQYKGELGYLINSSIYKTGNEYRFLKQSRDNAQIEFVMDSLKSDRFFEKVLKYLNCTRTLTEISNFVCEHAGCTIQEAAPYVQWLISNQIISHSLEANITGEDHLKRVLSATKNSDRADSSVEAAFNNISAIHHISDLDRIPDSNDDLKSNDLYVNLNAKFSGGELNAKYQQDIIDGLKCLDHFTILQQPAALTEFVKRYIQKFDKQAVPLLTAIDPEIGVGYSDLAVEEDDVNIAKNIVGSARNESRALTWSNAHILLFNKWRRHDLPNNVITITDTDLQDIKQAGENYAPTTSVIFRILDDKVFIESAGGICASSLLGRFTPFDTEIRQLARDMAIKEAQHNPDIIFAEIAHICHDHTANIDRREHIYPYEIPVLVRSTMPPQQQIQLNDLWLSVVNDQIILTSKKHGKRVVPRLSSAFNYTRNDLAVFRFLCDLQKAYVKTNFNLSLSQFFPGLNFYPRVEYKNTILHLAYWNLKKEAFADILRASTNMRSALFKTMAQQLSLPQHIALTQHDHQLVFDLNNEADIAFFLDTIKNQHQFTVKEYIPPSGKNPVVANSDNAAYVNQFIASLYHRQQVYKPVTSSIINYKQRRTFIPGSEWLYIKLYCHPIRSNEILTNCINTIIKKLNKAQLINQWFFIRYNDPAYHIRLRLRIDPKSHQEVLNVLHQNINNYVNNGMMNNYTIATYEREMERYGHLFMDDFEYAFYTSSNFVSSFLNHAGEMLSVKDILSFAMVSAKDMMVALGFDGKDLISFTEHVFDAFAAEFNWINDLKHQLDTEYRKQRQAIDQVMQNSDQYYKDQKLNKARALFINSLTRLKSTTSNKAEWKNKWVSDLVHMHLNRLFVNDPRKQEMTVYYFLYKYERSAQARSVNKQRR